MGAICSVAEALAIAENVTGLDARTLLRVSRVGLLESALPAPQAGFGDVEFYPDFVDKAAVLVVHIARSRPLPDGNKRLAWVALAMFCALNGRYLTVATDDAVAFMLAAASGEKKGEDGAVWLAKRVQSRNGQFRRLRSRLWALRDTFRSRVPELDTPQGREAFLARPRSYPRS